MDTSQPELHVLTQQYEHLTAELKAQTQQLSLLQTRAMAVISPFHASLQRKLRHPPGPRSSHYRQSFQAHWGSYELFAEKLAGVARRLAQPRQLPALCSAVPASQSVKEWAAVVDELEELHERREQRRAQRDLLLLLVDVLDGAERLSALRPPHSRGRGRLFAEHLHSLRLGAAGLGHVLESVLVGQGLGRIPLAAGQYPPPETTRIIARRDHHTSDNIVIAEVVTAGYTWQGGLLRKADVVVVTEPHRSLS